MNLTSEQKQFYRDNGYLVLESVVNDALLAELRNKIDEFLTRSAAVPRSNAVYDLDPSHSETSPKVRRIKDPHVQDPLFKALSKSDQIVGPVAELLGGTVRFDHSKLNFKPAHSNAQILWHQDWAFYPYTNDDLLAVGVMVEDCTHDNGPLMVVPGSHRGPVYDHHHQGTFAGGIREDDIQDEIARAVELTAPAGSISIHHVRTLHASRNNNTASLRPLLLFSYAAVDAFPVFNHYEINEFDSRILRGEPTLDARMSAVPVRIPEPRIEDQDSIYDNQSVMIAAGKTL